MWIRDTFFCESLIGMVPLCTTCINILNGVCRIYGPCAVARASERLCGAAARRYMPGANQLIESNEHVWIRRGIELKPVPNSPKLSGAGQDVGVLPGEVAHSLERAGCV